MGSPRTERQPNLPPSAHKKSGLRVLNQALPSTIRDPRTFQRLASMKSVTATDASGWVSELRGLEFASGSTRFDGAEPGLNSISGAQDASSA
jgi:hypothetical protein